MSTSSEEEEARVEKEVSRKGKMSAAETQESGIDVMSPYYIHASDNSGQIFVSELLHDGNYGEWVADMSNALYAKNKIGFVDGTIPMPGNDSPNLAYWMRCNAMVKGWLKSAMNKEVRSSVRYVSTAQEIWMELEERFAKWSAPRAYEPRRAISILRQEKLSVPSYYTKLKGLWDEIQSIAPWPKCMCGGCKCDMQKKLMQMKEKDQLYDFLMEIDDVFATVKTQILSMKPTASLGHA
ncbi:Retrotransposon gag domain [Sesbania bispinosa]|nr:Retrotransposon gag domain [Sesbania bispinosa]